MTEQIFHFKFEQEHEERLDKFLVSSMPKFSRTRLQDLIKEGLVTVENQPVTKPRHILTFGQNIHVKVPPVEETSLLAEDIPLDIIYEDQDFMVINKAAGMVVHPGAGHATGTLVNAALAYATDLQGIGGELRPGVVHRLDKDTSGLILMAKNSQTHEYLQNQFRLRKVKKTYLALVDGAPPTPKGRIDAPIGRDTTKRKQMEIKPNGRGRVATTDYFTVEEFRSHALLEAKPLTGRTHQIRLHLAFIGCPIVGDTIYGHTHPSLPISRHFLHAAKLELVMPESRQIRIFSAPLPADLEVVLNQLRNQ